MPFLCPDCAAGSLEIVGALELPPDRWWDERALQALACARCGFRGLAVYEESRRGALDSEAVEHGGLRVGAETVVALLGGLAACPAPGNAACRCAAHERWGRAAPSGEWVGVAGVAGGFPLRPA
jgi:hypothetical protein